MSERELFLQTAEYAAEFVESLGTRPVCAEADVEELAAVLGGPLPEEGLDERAVIASLVEQAEPGIVGTASGRYFGFVTGGAEPAAVAADWLTSVWDQNAGFFACGPAAAVTIVCGQAGEVNTGAFDDLDSIADASAEAGAWFHVDGAFGLWAAVSDELRHLLNGADRADSWATDCHKWLNVPYDSGLAFCAHPDDHRAAMSVTASYLAQSDDGRERDGIDWTPEASRRARGFAVYAALRSLGRAGIAALVEACCANARRFAKALDSAGAEILNDVVLNQVLVRFGDGERTSAVIERVQHDGTRWLGGTQWNGEQAMRISVSNWRSTADDVDRSVAAILAAAKVPA